MSTKAPTDIAQGAKGSKTMRLKDADALSRALCEFVHEKDDCVPCPNQTTSCLWSKVKICDFNRIIDNQPTIEAEPVKHGRWVLTDVKHVVTSRLEGDIPQTLTCSLCGFKHEFSYKYGYSCIWHYCPNCGAKMSE